MRRLVIILIAIMMLVSCSKKNVDDGSFKVVAIDFPSYDAARAVLGDNGNLKMLLPPGAVSHGYEPTAKDMVSLSEASLVVFTGGESDAWVEKILVALDEKVPSFRLVDQFELLEAEHSDGIDHEEHSHEHDHESELDEHVWTSPLNEIRIIEGLVATLSELDAENADEYESNGRAYIKELKSLDSQLRDIFQSSERNKIIFASRFPLLYFATDYGLDYHAAFPGCAEESEPSARTMATLIDIVKEENIPVIFNIEFGSPLIANTIAEESGAKVREFHSIHNITTLDFENGETYLTLMERNIEALKEAFL